MNYEALSNIMAPFAATCRQLNREAGEDLWRLADLLRVLRGLYICPECGRAALQVETEFCPKSEDYVHGHRAIWKCQSCGEMVVR